MKVTTDACLFGAILASEISSTNDFSFALDIGTGTGLLSLMLAQQFPSMKIKAMELDPIAAIQASENIDSSPWKNNIELIQGNILDHEPGAVYDLIFSNPPFYENDLDSPDEKINLARHNAELSLAKLFLQIRKLLKEQGEAWLLLPYRRQNEISQLLSENDLFTRKIILVRNSAKHDYFRIIVNIKKEKHALDETDIDEFTIYDSNESYTAAFEELLQLYYLRL